MPPDYLAVLVASYDYDAQSDDEISIAEGQFLLLLEKVDDEWWKVKIKAAQETESPVGLVPAAYVEQAEHTSVVRTLYDYDAAAPGELSVKEDDVLHVFETEDDWLLVQHSTEEKAGYVPGNYVEVVDESAPAPTPAPRIIVPDSPPRPVAPYVDPADRVAQSRAAPAPAAADDIQTWAVSEIDKKGKKKKGTLGIGNGNVFFASESDKTPVQKWQTKDLTNVVSEKAKHVRLDIGGPTPTTLHFHAGSKDHADAIITKLELSKSLATGTSAQPDSPPPEVSKKASVHFSNAGPVIIPEPDDEEEEEEQEEEEEEEEPQPRAPQRQTTSFLPPPRAPPRAVPAPEPEPEVDAEEEAVALYDFAADGEDELSVTEGERLAVLEKDGDEWWKCRNAKGNEGVVPASYLESVPNTTAPASKAKSAPSVSAGAAVAAAGAARAAEARRAKAEAEAEAERERLEAEAAEAAAAEAEAAAAEARKQRARKAEAQQKAKESAMAAEAQRQARVEAAANARASSPPVAQQSSRSRDPRTSSAAGSTNSKTSSEINRPPPEKTRVWHDRSGQFRVEAAFLGFNNGKLRLHKVNGVIVEVPSEKMSLDDMRYVERFLEKATRARPDSGAPRISEDDIPLGISRAASSGTQAKAKAAQQQQKKKGPSIDWFDFFLSAGCDLDDCTRYAAAFERDKLDEGLLADITEGTMRSLGLREGDILRVKKAVAKRAPGENMEKPSAAVQEQMRRDEELARQLQAQEGGKAPPHLFADASGVLKPRRGRPQAKNSVPLSTVDIKAIATASDQIQRTASPQTTQSPVGGAAARTATPVLPARPGSAAAAPLINGFDDDAWTNRPSSTKPTKAVSPPPAAPPVAAPVLTPTPAPAPQPTPTPTVTAQPPAPTPTGPPSLAKTTESDIFEQLAKLSVLRQNSTPARPPQQQQQQMGQMQQQAPSPAFNVTPAGYASGMGMGPSPVPMGHLSPSPIQQQQPQQPYNGPRGPFAPVPANQSLLQPLIPVPTQATGFPAFVPTKAPMNGGGPSPFGSGSMLSPTFLSTQPTGFVPQQQQQQPQMLMSQPTGFNPGFNPHPQPMMAQPTGAFGTFGGASPFGGQNQGQNGSGFGAAPIQSQMTGFRPPLNQSMFGPGPASPPPVPPLPSNVSNNTSPANVFAQMKSGTFANDNDNQSNTGLNGQTPVWGQTYQGYTGY